MIEIGKTQLKLKNGVVVATVVHPGGLFNVVDIPVADFEKFAIETLKLRPQAKSKLVSIKSVSLKETARCDPKDTPMTTIAVEYDPLNDGIGTNLFFIPTEKVIEYVKELPGMDGSVEHKTISQHKTISEKSAIQGK